MYHRSAMAVLTLMLSQPVLALTTICSGDYEPALGVATVKHEALWSFHDNWFFNLYLEMTTEVVGPVSPTVQEVYEMREGGEAVHFLDQHPAGEYSIHGQLQVGYPMSWGFDGLQILECPSWVGMLSGTDTSSANAQEQEDGSAPATANGASVQDVSTSLSSGSQECQLADKSSCAAEAAAGPGQGGNNVRLAAEGELLSGMVDAVDATGIVLRTMSNRYVSLALPARYSLTRRTAGSITDLQAGEVIGAQYGRGPDGELQVQRITLYRGQLARGALQDDSALAAPMVGIEARTVLQGPATLASKLQLPLSPVQGELELGVARSLQLDILRDASPDELLPHATRVRVRVLRESDATLRLTHIEIID